MRRLTPGTKHCAHCRAVKPFSEFCKTPRTNTGYSSWCKACRAAVQREKRENDPCVRERGRCASRKWAHENPDKRLAIDRRRRLRRYGITQEDYDDFLRKQRFRCATCLYTPADPYTLCVDHDHVTGRVRGLLCHRCNTASGLMGDDPARVARLARYLRRARG